ncbi:MAG TPA: sigma-54 dependent transcriptional regulator [Planctomycetota bacterium]|nr:sigma-54 dependent transcriptional regulator [Planctomycetota bacterium]
MTTRLLIAEDDPGAGEALRAAFDDSGYEVLVASTGAEARAAFATGPWDAVLTDIVMPDVDGLTLLREFVAAPEAPPVIVMTAYGSIERAVQAMKDGAFDFLEKPLDLNALRVAVQGAVERRRGEAAEGGARARIRSERKKLLVPGESPLLQRALQQARRVARTNATVLITGESGTGKELVARMIHAESLRVRGEFVAVNCAGLTESIIESELFGHVKGAFTGAVREKKGKFELADGGTLFLDEIGEIPLNVQVKLLRVLQEREVEPVGGEQTVPIDVRLICATHRDLDALVKAGRFREDLYYRIKVIVLKLPPLRERPEDIPALAEHFRKLANDRNRRKVQGFTPAALERLQGYAWPGNVRELENVVEQAVVLSRGETVDVPDLPEEITGDRGPQDVLRIPVGNTLADAERELILETLRKAGGNKTQAAKMLGIGVRTLYRKLEEYGQA